MRYRKLTGDGDYTFGNGQMDFWIDVPQAVGQAAMTRVQLWLGEWFLNINEGTAFMQGVFGKKTLTEANLTIAQRVSGTQGLVEIESLDSDVDGDTRLMTAQVTINTIYGPTSVEIANIPNY